ncbi:MAG: PLP-dependent transferase, partial [Deltaproteobacteria bacterium]|nr:PLP-dependent transferase [Deltaproteobacteria bacterium]
MRIATLCVHAGMTPDPATGAVVPPVYLTSTYHQPKVGGHKGFEYSRTQNPTRQHLEEAIAALEGARHGICFASGMAAVDAAVRLLKPGDTVLSLYDVYGGTYRLLSRLAGPMGLKETYLTVDKLNAMEPASFPDVQMIWVESPTNPLLRIVDIRRLALCAAAKGALLVVDNTFATPILQRPLALGAAVVVHSGTKYLAGHSDVIIGALATNDDELAARLRFVQNAAGAVPGPMDCFLTHRGIKTLKHRMTAHCEGALAVARALSQVRGVSRVCYPGLCDDTAAAIARSQMEGMGGIVTIEIRGGRDAAMKFLESLKVFTLAESLGGVESLACHPATMTHASIPADVRQAIGITDGLVRLSAGIEDPQDLVEDAV